jgi:hypothetical protein
MQAEDEQGWKGFDLRPRSSEVFPILDTPSVIVITATAPFNASTVVHLDQVLQIVNGHNLRPFALLLQCRSRVASLIQQRAPIRL